MKFYLLLGAGFSRNWGGWLASEAFEYLLGTLQVRRRPSLRKLLWENQEASRGFEGALDQLQRVENDEARSDLRALNDAVKAMFQDMNRSFSGGTEDFTFEAAGLLSRFDAIFTLNQDLLLEHSYLDQKHFPASKKWRRAVLPGIVAPDFNYPTTPSAAWHDHRWRVTDDVRVPGPHDQPIYKLHGSSQWYRDFDQDGLMVLGGGKADAIAKDPVLKTYDARFAEALNYGQYCRLMVIGYGFRDHHINKRILDAGTNGMKIFVIDPRGADAWVEPEAWNGAPSNNKLKPFLIGASQRQLSEIMRAGSVEGTKVMQFFEDD